MSASNHMGGYRQYTDAELTAERTLLMGQRTTFVSQGMGSKTFQRDLRLFEDRLEAINLVRRERGYIIPDWPPARQNPNVGVMDFSA